MRIPLSGQWASTQAWYGFANRWATPCLALAWLLIGVGIFCGLFVAPADYQQGDGFRIIYIHAPSAFLGMMIYMSMACAALVFFVGRTKVAAMWVRASAPMGAWFTFLALLTGSIWGKPMWGTWWIWDARLTSALLLLFLYLGYLGLHGAIRETRVADRVACLLVLVGVVNIPIIHYSVNWWNTLHQGATLSRFAVPAIAPSMLYPLLIMIAGFICFYVAVTLRRLACVILQREANSRWLQNQLSKEQQRGTHAKRV